MNKNEWKGREEVLNYLKPHLWRILYKESQPTIEYHLEQIVGLNPEELLVLKRINFLLSEEVKSLLDILPHLMRNLAHSTRKETIECRGMVRGRIDWGLTIKERYSQGFNDPSLFICKPASKMYDLPENQLLKFILHKIVNFGGSIEYIPVLAEDILDETEVNNYIDIIQVRRAAVRNILKHVQFRNITLPPFIRAKTLQKARNHRNYNYRYVVKCYELYEDLFVNYNTNALKKLLEKQLLEPLNNDKLYELYILFNVLEKLEEKGGKVSVGLLKPGKKRTPYVAQYHDDNETINVYYQKMPGGCWKDSEYKDIFKFYNLNVSSRRPDIILEFVEDDSYCLIEVKRTNKRDYIVDSVYKVIGYLSDFKKCFPDKNVYNGILVVWKGIQIENWIGALKKPVLVLSNSDLDKGLNNILYTPDQSIQMIKLITDTFDKRFEHWNITIPEEDTKNRRNGYIQKAGWLIQYCFGKDEKGDYLDYYAAHRMTDDKHVRIYSNGEVEDLPALEGMFLTSQVQVEAKRLEEKHDEYNRQVTEMLVEKGFDKFTINMYLHAGIDKKDK